MGIWNQFGLAFSQKYSTELLTNGKWDATNPHHVVTS